ncbi:MAG: hypothetical protein ABIH86_04280 [Planctomycetota bacterium]
MDKELLLSAIVAFVFTCSDMYGGMPPPGRGDPGGGGAFDFKNNMPGDGKNSQIILFNSGIDYYQSIKSNSLTSDEDEFSLSNARMTAGAFVKFDQYSNGGLSFNYDRTMIDSNIVFPDTGLGIPESYDQFGLNVMVSAKNKTGVTTLSGNATHGGDESINSTNDLNYSMMVSFRFPGGNNEFYSANFMFGSRDGVRGARPMKDFGGTGDEIAPSGTAAIMGGIESSWEPNKDFRAAVNLRIMMMGFGDIMTAGIGSVSAFWRPVPYLSLSGQYGVPDTGRFSVGLRSANWLEFNLQIGDKNAMTRYDSLEDMEATLCSRDWAVELGMTMSPLPYGRITLSGGYLFHRSLVLEYLTDYDSDDEYDDMDDEDIDLENTWSWTVSAMFSF